MQIFYKQSVNMKNNGWGPPMKTKDNAWQDSKACHWNSLKKSAMAIMQKIPFGINKIDRWHKTKGHSVVRVDKVNNQYRTTYLMVTING